MENNIDEKSYVDSDIEEIDEVHSNMGTYSNLGNVSNPFKDITSSFDAPNLSTELYNAIPSVFQDETFGMFNRAIASPIIDTADFAIRTADTAIKGFATGVNELKNLYTGENDDRLKRDIYGFFTAGSPAAAARPVNISGRVKQLIDKGDNIEAGKLMYSHVNPVAAMSVKKPPSMAMTKPKTNDDFNYLREGSTIRVDNPNFKDAITGESYVARKIRENNEFKKRNPNTGPIGAFSGTTGFVDNIKFNPKELINFKGAAGEEKYRMSGLRMENLKKSIAEKGYIKADEGGDRILIHVTEDGTPYITEGNHRLAEAFMSKRPFISADIRYLRGGEAVDGPLNPKKIGIKTSDLTEQTSKKSDPLTDQMIPVFPKREALFPKGEAPKGGDYLNPITGEVLTNRNVSSANVKIKPDGNPDFKVSNDNIDSVGTIGKGNTDIKVNLFKRFSQKPKEGTTRSPDAKGNWRWTKLPEGISPNTQTIISVKQKGNHYFTLETDFSKGVSLKTYPNQKSEPRLKPTVVGKIELGNPVGEVIMRGEKRIVYDKITTFNTGGLVKKKGLMSRA